MRNHPNFLPSFSFLLFFSLSPLFSPFFLLPPLFSPPPLKWPYCRQLAVHRLNHSATSSPRVRAIEADGNTATHPEREGMEEKELDTGDEVPKMASYARLRKTTQALEGPSRRGWDSNLRVQSTMD